MVYVCVYIATFVLILAVMYITLVEFIATFNLLSTIMIIKLYHTPSDIPLPHLLISCLNSQPRRNCVGVKKDSVKNQEEDNVEKAKPASGVRAAIVNTHERNAWQKLAYIVNHGCFIFSLIFVVFTTAVQIVLMHT